MLYREWIDSLRDEYVGKTVTYKGNDYKVMDVDYNGALLINLPAQYTDTTAVGRLDVTVKE